MRVAVFGTKPYDRDSLEEVLRRMGLQDMELHFLKPRLDAQTAPLAAGHEAVCIFVNDLADVAVLEQLAEMGVKMIALRCAGFNNVDLDAAMRLGFKIGRVPAYSPYAVAEHTIGMMLALNRKLHRAYNRVREGNFALHGLLGFDLHGRTVGVVGTGKIGQCVCRPLLGFGCRVLAFDMFESEEMKSIGVEYVPMHDLLSLSDIVTLHCPLTPETHHLINQRTLEIMKPGVMLINTSRGGLLNTAAVLDALKSGQIAHLGLDVYEEEGPLFFEDRSGTLLQDDVFARLLTFPNVLVTGHQAFFTQEALARIAEVTLTNLSTFAQSGTVPAENAVEA